MPRRPRLLRRMNLVSHLRRTNPDVIVIWNRFEEHKLMRAISSASEAPVVHCECGGAWYGTSARDAERYLGGAEAALCASRACRRLLELRWGWKDRVVVLNGLRPDCRFEGAEPRSMRGAERIKLGVAARLVPAKGVCLALHALKGLRDSGYDGVLHVAGGGSSDEEKRFRGLVRKLGLSSQVILHGIVSDMASFYKSVDIFLCPSIREPFGSVCVEASALGCVVVASRVDGLPEAIEDGVSGYCLPPTLAIADYPRFGGNVRGLPELVYDPASDELVVPRFVAPQAIAGTIVDLVESPNVYERMSQAALERVKSKFHFADYVADLDDFLAGMIGRDGNCQCW